MKKITPEIKTKIMEKLCPSGTCGYDTYIGRGLTYCNYGGNIEKTFYTDGSFIPVEKSIFK